MSTFVLNLSEGFIPHPNLFRIKFESFIFSGGECHIKLLEDIPTEVSKVIITQRITQSSDVMLILLAKDALERKGVRVFELVIPYMPYARQDRQCAMGESFSLNVFSDIINSQNFEKVTIFDAHSDVGPALLHRSVNIDNSEYVKQAIKHLGKSKASSDMVLISPDAGSNKKCNKLFSDLKMFNKLVKCDKIRDLDTGKLSGFAVFADDLEGAPCIMVDDICDGGGTFIGLAEELKRKNAGPLYLFVSHGIFSKGFKELTQVFDMIYTTNSFKDFKKTKGLKQFNFKTEE